MAGVGDRHSWVRWEALSNLSAPVDALVAAMRYRGSKTRQLIASHPHLPEDLAVKLSMSKMKEVQEALAGNPVVSERIRVVARLKAEAGRM